MIKIFCWFKDLDSCTLLSFEVFHIKNICHKSICYLPRRVDFDKVSDVIIHRRQKFVLNWWLLFLESLTDEKFFVLLRIVLFKLVKIYFTHFSLNLSLNIQSFLKFLKTIFEFSMVTIFDWGLLICLYFLFTKHFTKFFSNDHQWFKSFFNSFRNTLDKRIVWKDISWLGNVSSLEHFLPYFIRSCKKADTNCLHRNILSFYINFTKFSSDILLHSFIEFLDIWLVGSKLGVSLVLMQICYRMMMKPNLQQVHEYFSTRCIWFEQLISLLFPLFTQLIRYLFHKYGVLIKSILIFFVFEEGEIGVIENLILLLPNKVILCLLCRKWFASSWFFLILHHWKSLIIFYSILLMT